MAPILIGVMNPKKILVVDDSPIILRTLSMKLRSQGYTVLTAADGGSAVSLVRREKPDLIVLDINFPPDVGSGGGVQWDGFRIIDWLRRLEEARDVPTIIITGSTEAKYKELAVAAGAVGFFQKPIDHEKLVAAIREALGQNVPIEQASA